MDALWAASNGSSISAGIYSKILGESKRESKVSHPDGLCFHQYKWAGLQCQTVHS